MTELTGARARKAQTLTRITATINALEHQHEKIGGPQILSPDSSCAYIALSDIRVWLGTSNGQEVTTIRYVDISALAITDPLGEDDVWLRITAGGIVWSIDVGSSDIATGLFKTISRYTVAAAYEPDDY